MCYLCTLRGYDHATFEQVDGVRNPNPFMPPVPLQPFSQPGINAFAIPSLKPVNPDLDTDTDDEDEDEDEEPYAPTPPIRKEVSTFVNDVLTGKVQARPMADVLADLRRDLLEDPATVEAKREAASAVGQSDPFTDFKKMLDGLKTRLQASNEIALQKLSEKTGRSVYDLRAEADAVAAKYGDKLVSGEMTAIQVVAAVTRDAMLSVLKDSSKTAAAKYAEKYDRNPDDVVAEAAEIGKRYADKVASGEMTMVDALAGLRAEAAATVKRDKAYIAYYDGLKPIPDNGYDPDHCFAVSPDDHDDEGYAGDEYDYPVSSDDNSYASTLDRLMYRLDTAYTRVIDTLTGPFRRLTNDVYHPRFPRSYYAGEMVKGYGGALVEFAQDTVNLIAGRKLFNE